MIPGTGPYLGVGRTTATSSSYVTSPRLRPPISEIALSPLAITCEHSSSIAGPASWYEGAMDISALASALGFTLPVPAVSAYAHRVSTGSKIQCKPMHNTNRKDYCEK
eukprot:161283-Rhodomonas_salina.1